MFKLKQVAHWLGEDEQCCPEVVCDRINTDTRQLKDGDLFVALKGANFDAHDFLTDVARYQRVAAIVSLTATVPPNLPVIRVQDPLVALQKIAKKWRHHFRLPTIAVTGSNGKTTVKEMLAHIGRTWVGDDAVIATQGNLNNDIGVPLSVLRLNANHRYAVFELGMNHPGEIAVIAPIVQAHIALVNNAQREHQEFMGSVVNVAKENGSVFGSLRRNGVAVYPLQEEFVKIWQAQALEHWQVIFATSEDEMQAKTLSQSVQARWRRPVAVVFKRSSERQGRFGQSLGIMLPEMPYANSPAETCYFELPLLGEHNISNSAAAFVCARLAGVPSDVICSALANFNAVKGRMQVHVLSDQVTVIDDTYNANPDSVIAAMNSLVSMPGKRLFVLGDMGEVGAHGRQYHEEVAAHAKAIGLTDLITIGELAQYCAPVFGSGASHYSTMEELQNAVLRWVAQHGAQPISVLVKGSRFMKMEQVLMALEAQVAKV